MAKHDGRKFNKGLIAKVLERAIKKLKQNHKRVEYSDLLIDRDTKDVPGSLNIPQTIDKKISSCQIFVGDMTIVNRSSFFQRLFKSEPSINNNVLIEYGQAKGSVGEKAVITFFNEAYCKLEENILPFDIRQSRWPTTFNLSSKNWAMRDKIIEDLSTTVAAYIKEIIDYGIKNPSVEYYPFLDWQQWGNELNDALEIEYVSTGRLDEVSRSITKDARRPKTVQRVAGLSGLGKTRLVYEAFNPKREADIVFANRILYLDFNNAPDAYKSVLFKLSETNVEKILVLDSCSQGQLAEIYPIIQKSTSKLSVIAIDHNVPISHLDRDARFTLVELVQDDS